MRSRRALTISILSALAAGYASAQMTPQQILQHQQALERQLQLDYAQREQREHDAQLEQMRQIDRQQAEDERALAEKARAQAIAAQEQQFQEQLAEQQAEARRIANQEQSQSAPRTPGEAQQSAQPTEQQSTAATAARWSLKNMTALDKAGLGALAVLLAALAFAAGIVPSSLAPKWIGRYLLPPGKR